MSTSASLAGRELIQVALPSDDLARSVAWYRDTLGLPLMFEVSGMAFFKVGGLRLMIGDRSRNDEAEPFEPGGSVIYFDAPDLPDLADGLEARGVEFMGPAEVLQRTDEGELQLRFFKDPDGNLLALMGTVAAR